MKKLAVSCWLLAVSVAMATGVTMAGAGVSVGTPQQRYPWNGKMDIPYTLTGTDAEDAVGKIVATDGAKITSSGLVTLLGGPVRGTFTAKIPGVVMLFQ